MGGVAREDQPWAVEHQDTQMRVEQMYVDLSDTVRRIANRRFTIC